MVFAVCKLVFDLQFNIEFSIPQQNRHDDLAVSSLTRRHTCEALFFKLVRLETNAKN
jgi:hypothetical protein